MSEFRIIGAGSPLVDYSAAVDDGFLSRCVPGCKGGTIHIGHKEREQIFAGLSGKELLRTPGGAAANTISALGKLGVDCAFFGKAGVDDDGDFFHQELLDSGVSAEYLIRAPGETGYCISLVTPDAERTMRSNLGISTALTPDEWEKCGFSKFSWLLSEGYMLQIDSFDRIFDCAHAGNCATALDLSSVEIAYRMRDTLPELIKNKIDLVLCNADEAAALTGIDSPEKNAEYLAQKCSIAVVKTGAAGSLIKRAGEAMLRIPPFAPEKVLDTTAAGDHYAAGFFYGLAHGKDLEKCGICGSLLGGAVTGVKGSRLPPESWREIKNKINQL